MKKYQRTIVFTKVPLNGYYRYKDLFQIFPADFSDMPDSPYKRHYPNILEYWVLDEEIVDREMEFEDLKDLFNLTATIIPKEDKYISLLNSFTNNRFFKYANFDGIWSIPVLIDKETNRISEKVNFMSSQWSMQSFHFPSLPNQLQITKFTSLMLNPILRIEHFKFYTYDPHLDINRKKRITLPKTIDLILDSYFSLDNETMQIVDAAIGYNTAAIDLLETKRTLALLSSFTSMETMINLEYRDEDTSSCKECGQTKFSIARKFREYLLKYIGDSAENKKKFNAYYSLRSKIVHTGMRLKSELLFSDFPKQDLDSEYLQRIEILQVGKLAIANWLLKNNNSQKK
jgi:hypothetical protein